MNSLAAVILLLLGIVVVIQLTRGTLGSWLKAKFLGQAPPATSSGGGS